MNSDQEGQIGPQEAQPDPGQPGAGGVGATGGAQGPSEQSAGLPPPGWYIDSEGVNRWWDGAQWGKAAESQAVYGTGNLTGPATTGYYQQQVVSVAKIAPPPPPWGTWTWQDGTPIDINTLPSYDSNKKLVAGLLGIFLGSLGVHKFILGMTTEGVITLVLSLVTCGIFAFVPLIEGIIYLTKSDEEFYWTYVVGKKKWF